MRSAQVHASHQPTQWLITRLKLTAPPLHLIGPQVARYPLELVPVRSSRSEIGSYRKKILAATRPEREEDEPEAKDTRKESVPLLACRSAINASRPTQKEKRSSAKIKENVVVNRFRSRKSLLCPPFRLFRRLPLSASCPYRCKKGEKRAPSVANLELMDVASSWAR